MTGPTQVTTSLESLLAAREVAICCGSGGVGKTTTSAALGLMAATHLGGRVLVLTVDPARRLATALGLDEIGDTARPIPTADLESVGTNPRGELWVAMLDTQASWDALVRRHAPDRTTAARILANPLYRNLTRTFVQSHDYIAMERLYELHSSGEWDLLVIDTPPSRNAIDFLAAPERMADFFSSRFLRILTAPARSRLATVASRPFYQVADRILGSQFLEDIAEFFLLFQSMYDGFVTRARAVGSLLADQRTTFVVVSTLEEPAVREAQYFCGELERRNLPLGAVVLNRVLPGWFGDDAHAAAERMERHPDAVATALQGGGGPLADVDQRLLTRVVQSIGATFGQYRIVAQREAEQRAVLAGRAGVTAEVPLFENDVSDLDGVVRMADSLRTGPPGGERRPGRPADAG